MSFMLRDDDLPYRVAAFATKFDNACNEERRVFNPGQFSPVVLQVPP